LIWRGRERRVSQNSAGGVLDYDGTMGGSPEFAVFGQKRLVQRKKREEMEEASADSPDPKHRAGSSKDGAALGGRRWLRRC